MQYIHDADEAIQQRISPLQLMGEQILDQKDKNNLKQLTLNGGDNPEKTELTEAQVGVFDLLELEFKEIKDDTFVKPRL
jgi:hypothetical protein